MMNVHLALAVCWTAAVANVVYATEPVAPPPFSCAFPAESLKYSVITQGDARIGAHTMSWGLAIGGTLTDTTPDESGTIDKTPSIVKTLATPNKFNFNGGVTAGADLPVGLFEHFEWLARNVQSSVSGNKKVISVNKGGTFHTYNFNEGGQGEDNGNTVVFFNCTDDITITKTPDGRQFGPTIVAPFSKVTVLGEAGFVDGLIVAKTLETKDGDGQLQLHGDVFMGILQCPCPNGLPPVPTTKSTPAPLSLPPPTTAPVKLPTKAPCANYVCPAYSKQIPGRACYSSFDDCQCDVGYKKDYGECVADCPDYVCPANSMQIPELDCYRSMDDCQCDAGFKKENGQCVVDCPNYVCPANSMQIPGRSCYRSMDDCQCDAGFKKENGQCVVDCPNYVCPANSMQIPGRSCYRSLDDCQCDAGFKKENGQCVVDCPNYVCPANSMQIPGRSCYRSMDDCQCNTGYIKVDGQCIYPPTQTPTKVPIQPPTKAPTVAPTNAPVTAPTKIPTKAPTGSPIKLPTKAPVNAPTEAPAASPTKAPYKAPTGTPTKLPTKAPVNAPTETPVVSPTKAPYKAPTGTPTKIPTKAPVNAPTVAPSALPTKAPFKAQTETPAASPTKAPYKAATGTPTKFPTIAPVNAPSEAPVKLQTKAPTKSLTTGPTRDPTSAPSGRPMNLPTNVPSKKPSKAPSKSPTMSPVQDATKAPTGQPMYAPTNVPSKIPTASPVKPPTKAPYKAATKPPTLAPTTKPTTIVSEVKELPKNSTGSCLEDKWKRARPEELMCTSKEVYLESIKSTQSLTCQRGEMVTLTVESIMVIDGQRNDLGWYVAVDGGDALTGTCAVNGLQSRYRYAITDIANQQSAPPVWTTEQGGDGDECGDFAMNYKGLMASPVFVNVTLPCTDENYDGILDVAICFTWRSNAVNKDECQLVENVPGSDTGCYCTRYDIPNVELKTSEKPC